MNLNEVKKHVYFNLAIYIGIGICFIISLIAILITPVKAQTTLVSQDITNSVFPYTNLCSGSYKDYCVYYNGSVNATTFTIPNNELMGANNVLSFAFATGYGFYQSAPTTITIDFTNNIKNNGSYNCSIETTDGYLGNCTATRTANAKMNINFNSLAGATGQYQFFISNSSGVNSSDYFGIKKITVYQTVGSDNSDIINNANQNTQDIINNSNSNTSDTISAIDVVGNTLSDLVGNLCPNRANWPNGEQNKIVINATHNDTVIATGQTINLTAGVKYYFSYERSCVGDCVSQSPYDIFLLYNGGYAYFINNQHSGFQFIPENSGSYELRVDCNISGDTCSYWNFYVGTVGHNYCPYGSYLSKLDDTNEQLGGIYGGLQETNDKVNDIIDQQQDTYDYLTDNTQPTPNTNEISNVLGLVSTNDPLIYLTTLPITLLNKINVALNSNQCTDFNIGAFGVIGGINLGNYTFKFPCLDIGRYIGNSLWNTIDVIVGIGLLALSIYKFYHMITNILSLGAEDKASKISHYFTPMEFLSLIIEGDVPGITIRKGVVN